MIPDVHEPLPVWLSQEGKRYCAATSEHDGRFVEWPCEEAE